MWMKLLFGPCPIDTVWPSSHRHCVALGVFQNEVRVLLTVGPSSRSQFRVVLRCVNPGAEVVAGLVTLYPSGEKAGGYIFRPLWIRTMDQETFSPP